MEIRCYEEVDGCAEGVDPLNDALALNLTVGGLVLVFLVTDFGGVFVLSSSGIW
jgi:hypothetical protein